MISGGLFIQHTSQMASSEVEEQQSINPVGSGWVGGWRVGKGSYGTVSIFVRQNARGLIEDVSQKLYIQILVR